MKRTAVSALFIAAALGGCLNPYSVSGLKPGMAKQTIVSRWGHPAVVPKTLRILDGTIMEIYQYESGNPPDITTLYFREDQLWYWDKKNWRGTSFSEYVPKGQADPKMNRK